MQNEGNRGLNHLGLGWRREGEGGQVLQAGPLAAGEGLRVPGQPRTPGWSYQGCESPGQELVWDPQRAKKKSMDLCSLKGDRKVNVIAGCSLPSTIGNAAHLIDH